MTLFRSGIFKGDVIHARIRPKMHKLHYSVFSFLLNVDELNRLDKKLWFFSLNRFNLFSFYDEDFGPSENEPIGNHVRGLLQRFADGTKPWRIELLCYPRVLGYTFNPLVIYYCRDDDGELKVIIYEVNNTFGERQSYVVPVTCSDDGPDVHSCSKLMDVSPFNACSGDYSFHIREPGEDIVVSVLHRDSSGPLLRALFTGVRQELSDASLMRTFFAYPFLTLKVTAAIHFEALKLWVKGLPLKRRKKASNYAVTICEPNAVRSES